MPPRGQSGVEASAAVAFTASATASGSRPGGSWRPSWGSNGAGASAHQSQCGQGDSSTAFGMGTKRMHAQGSASAFGRAGAERMERRASSIYARLQRLPGGAAGEGSVSAALSGSTALYPRPLGRLSERLHRTRGVMLLVVLSGALVLLAQTANGASPATRVALFDSAYGAEATYNLSMWRASLFSRLEQFISDNPALHLHHEVRAEEWHKRFEPFQPFITCPPDQRLERVGNEHDGGKWLCGLDKMKAPCNVISVGSFNDYGFEQAVLQNTKCNITTLDCTVSKPRVQDPARHKFFKKCMSSEATVTERKDFMSYRDLVEGELRLPSTDAPLLKIDIEGYEFPVMSEWTPDTPNLPSQIAVEIHVASWKRQALSKTHPIWNRHRLGVLDLGLFFAHLAELGYGIVSKEDNEYCGNCSEFTLFRVEAAVPSRATASRISQLRRHRNRRLRRARRHA